MKDLILLSGGIDSTCLLYWKKPSLAITIDYGQVCANAEINSSRIICKETNTPHNIVKVDCSTLGIGNLAKKQQLDISPNEEWWPFRNQFLLTVASMVAISLNLKCIYFGAVKTDTLYKDTSKHFFRNINKLINLQEGNLNIFTPAINMTPLQLIKKSKIPESLLGWTHSCNSSIYACGQCPSCIKHQNILGNLNFNF